MAETWDRQPGESEEAYRAFCVFRDMGPDRELIGAYRSTRGTAGGPPRDRARNTPGRWKTWAADHEWRRRALAWDNRRDAAATRAVERVADQEGEKWGRRLTAQADADFAFSQKYAAEVARRLNDADRLQLMTPRDLKACMDVTVAASGLAWAAIAAALPDTYADLDYHTATTEQLTAALERLDATIGAATGRGLPQLARTG
jgi:hypothetical protein